MHFTLILIYSFLLSLSLSYFFFDTLKLSSLSTLYLLYACGFCVDFPLIFFFNGFLCILCCHGGGVFAVVVGCCCGGEVEGVGLWIGAVEV